MWVQDGFDFGQVSNLSTSSNPDRLRNVKSMIVRLVGTVGQVCNLSKKTRDRLQTCPTDKHPKSGTTGFEFPGLSYSPN